MVELNLDMWLTAEDIEKTPRGFFLNEGKQGLIPAEGDKEDITTFEILVELEGGAKRLWTMNNTSQRTIAKMYGTNTAAWVGKPFVCMVANQNVKGKMKKIVYAKTLE